MILPSTVYKRPSNPSADAVAMLDGTPIKRPLSQSSDSRSSRFREHMVEMEDTSFRPPPDNAGKRDPRTPDTDSPTLGRDSGLSGPSLNDDVRRRQHLMSWSTYESNDVGQADGQMGSTMTPKSPPAARSPHQVSPDMSNAPRDSKFVVSPMGSIDRGRI